MSTFQYENKFNLDCLEYLTGVKSSHKTEAGRFAELLELLRNDIQSGSGYTVDSFIAAYNATTSNITANKGDDGKLVLSSDGENYTTDQFIELYNTQDSNITATKDNDGKLLLIASRTSDWTVDDFLAVYSNDSDISASKDDDNNLLLKEKTKNLAQTENLQSIYSLYADEQRPEGDSWLAVISSSNMPTPIPTPNITRIGQINSTTVGIDGINFEDFEGAVELNDAILARTRITSWSDNYIELNNVTLVDGDTITIFTNDGQTSNTFTYNEPSPEIVLISYGGGGYFNIYGSSFGYTQGTVLKDNMDISDNINDWGDTTIVLHNIGSEDDVNGSVFQIVTAYGKNSNEKKFFEPPEITGITYDGTTMTINGLNFNGDGTNYTKVYRNGNLLASDTWTNNQITVSLGNLQIEDEIYIITNDGRESNNYTYQGGN